MNMLGDGGLQSNVQTCSMSTSYEVYYTERPQNVSFLNLWIIIITQRAVWWWCPDWCEKYWALNCSTETSSERHSSSNMSSKWVFTFSILVFSKMKWAPYLCNLVKRQGHTILWERGEGLHSLMSGLCVVTRTIQINVFWLHTVTH